MLTEAARKKLQNDINMRGATDADIDFLRAHNCVLIMKLDHKNPSADVKKVLAQQQARRHMGFVSACGH